MSTDTEKGLETLIVESLVSQAAYVQGRSEDYDRDHAVDLAQLQAFVNTTRPDTAEALGLGEETPRRMQFLHRLQGEIASQRLPIPPQDEQTRLLQQFDSGCDSILAAVAKAEREIDLVREYRTQLIAGTVTGKVDVRDLAPAEPPPADGLIDERIDDEEMLGDHEPELVEEATDAEE